MKEKKFDTKDKIIFLLILAIVILIIALLMLIFADKKELCVNNEASCNYENTNNNNNNNNNNNQISCTKESISEDNLKETYKYAIFYDKTGEILNYKITFTTIYLNKYDYNIIKSSENKNEFEFNDEKLEITKTFNYNELKDTNGNIQHIWYKNMIDSLKNDGYICN